LWEPEYKGQSFKWDIYILDIQTGEFRFLVEGREPVWSPDGTRIAYVWGGGLWVMDVESDEEEELFPAKEDCWLRDVSWSPDGRRITFLYQEGGMGGLLEMLIVSADGKEEAIQSPPPTGGLIGSPIWSPSGKILYVIGERDIATARWFHNLWTMDVDSSKQTQLTKESAVMSFAPAPDGDWIVFSGGLPYEEASLSYNLWLFDIDGSRLSRLTQGTFSDYDPQWSPDGKQVIFRREGKGILALNLADGSLTQVHRGPADFSVTRQEVIK
jgi:Tol biopolymer transport system component